MRPTTPVIVVVCGGLILSLSMGLRQSLGLFLEPMNADLRWGLTALSMGLAVQNLLWGLALPFAGMLADRHGTGRTLALGGTLYAIGLLIAAHPASPALYTIGTGVIVGLGVAGTGFPIVLAAVARAAPPEKRSTYLGIASAGGSFGQFALAPVSQQLIEALGWSGAMAGLALLSLVMAPLALALRGKPAVSSAVNGTALGTETLTGAVREAGQHPGYLLLTSGFFVCGFHVAFIAVHMPGYLATCNMPAELAATSLALIGFFNMLGSFLAGVAGERWRKKYLLSAIYAARAAVIVLFLALPVSEISVLAFSAAMGFLWLSTVPLTSGLVAQIFGPRYMATLFGIVLLSHQIGAFLGAWMGGYVFDLTGSYDMTWAAAVGLGLFAAAVHLPIGDRPLRTA